MKKTLRFTALSAVLIMIFMACEKTNNQGGNKINNEPRERTIIYTVGNSEARQTLATEGEWDVLVDVLCDQARGGKKVTFYNMSQTTYLQNHGLQGSKAAITFSTTNREEMKAWMKKMEKEGRTVVVSYDNGTWNGMAYATAPPTSTSSTIVGTWHFTCSVVNHIGPNGTLTGSDLYVPEDGGGSMYYTFYDDGTITLSITGMDGTTATETSTWTLSTDGKLSSDLLPSGTCWDVNWITDNTLIMSRADLGTEEGDIVYQLQFDRK